MGDYFCTRTLEPSRIENGISSVRLGILDYKRKNVEKGSDRLYFEIPLEFHLHLGDRIDFYQGRYRSFTSEREPATEGIITHKDYISANIIRKNKELLTICAKDMQLLTQIRKEYENQED